MKSYKAKCNSNSNYQFRKSSVIFIKNRSRKFCKGLSRLGFNVLKTDSPLYIQQQQDEFFLRSYSEFLDNKEKGGKTYFITLTYAPQCLPIFNTEFQILQHGEDKVGIPCFSKSDIDRYMNTVRRTFNRRGLNNIRHIVYSEYGTSEDGTHRPHYHALIYVPSTSISDSEVKSILLRSWKFGISSFSRRYGATIANIRALKYCCKYASKQVDFYAREDLKQYLSKGKSSKDRIKKYLPRHWQSKGFGLHLMKYLTNMSTDDLVTALEQGVSSDYLGLGVQRFYKIPRYIYNKIVYEYDENNIRRYTATGYEVCTRMFNVRLRKCEESLSKFFTTQGLAAKIGSDDVKDVIEFIHSDEYSSNFNGLVNYLYDAMNGRSLKELALYKNVFQNLTLPYSSKDVESLNSASVDELESLAFFCVDSSFEDDYFTTTSSGTSAYEQHMFDNCKLYNHIKRFERFDEILSVINAIQSLQSIRIQKAKEKKQEVTNKLKNTLK